MSILYAPKLDMLTEQWLGYKVPFRNTLLQSLYPNINLVILKAATDPDNYDLMLRLLGDAVAHNINLDFCTGSKKRGEFIASSHQVARRFWDTPEQAAAYGSNLLTDCAQPVQKMPLRVLVVRDGEHGTGDCHAKLCPAFARRLGHVNRSAQFRIAFDRFLAKGTAITYSPTGPSLHFDIVLPLSTFKSAAKPKPGIHYWHEAHVAVQGWSSRRRAKVSYTVLQWFSKATIQHDVLPRVEPLLEKLIAAGRSAEAAIELLNLDADPDDQDEPLLHRILTADVNHVLIHHPWVVSKLYRLLRRRWLHAALGGGLKFFSLQGLPDDSLPLGVISTPDLAKGPVIATRYPVRSWADVQLWRNVRLRKHRDFEGVVWMSHETAMLVGGDFDGDWFNFLPADKFPAMATEIRHWRKSRQVPPVVKVKDRLASTWDDLPRVMMAQTDNMVGLITYFIAQAAAQRRLDYVHALAPELQIAVDKFKYNLTHDQDLIKSISDDLEDLDWLADRNGAEAFIERPIYVDPDASDTISHLARQVAAAWEPPNLLAAPLESFAPLFPEPEAHKLAAREMARRYARQVGAVIRSGDRDGFAPIFDALHEWADTHDDPQQWAAAIWHAVHRKGRNGTGSLAFHAFPDLVIERVVTPAAAAANGRVAIVGLPYHGHAEQDLQQFDGSQVLITITTTTWRDQLRHLASVAGKSLGLVSAETPIPTGIYTLSLTWNGKAVIYAA